MSIRPPDRERDTDSDEYLYIPNNGAGLTAAVTQITADSVTFNLNGETVRFEAASNDIVLVSSAQVNSGYQWLRVDRPAPPGLQRAALLNQAKVQDAKSATYATMLTGIEYARLNGVGEEAGDTGAMLAAIWAGLMAIFHKSKANELREQANQLPGY